MKQNSSSQCPFLPKNASYASLTRQGKQGSILKGKSPRKHLKVQILEGMLEEKSEEDDAFLRNGRNTDWDPAVVKALRPEEQQAVNKIQQ